MTGSDALPTIDDPTGEVAVNTAETARLLFSAGSVIGHHAAGGRPRRIDRGGL